MMRIVIATVMALTLTVSSSGHTTEVGSGDNQHPGEELTQCSTQSRMSNGVGLTGHQRQQMRDLMQQARHKQPLVNVSELETIHRLVTAESPGGNVVCTQAKRMADEQITHQVEMTKARNQMYCLLTSEQQAVLSGKHQQQTEQLRGVT